MEKWSLEDEEASKCGTEEPELVDDVESKSRTSNLVSSVPFREPTAHTNLVGLALIRQTTPPLPPLSKATKSRINSPEIQYKELIVMSP